VDAAVRDRPTPELSGGRRYPALTGMRALAATAVVLTHSAFSTGSYGDTPLGRLWQRLDLGVAVFFVLSGFLLARPFLLAARNGRPAPRTSAYLWRRALRVLPLYWATVVLAFLLLPSNHSAGPGEWLRHLFLLQNYTEGGSIAEGLFHTWSLSTEVAFYLVLPLGAAVLLRICGPGFRPARLLAALGGLTVVSTVWWCTVAGERDLGRPDIWLPGFLGWFAAGAALGVLSVADARWRPVQLATQLGDSLGTCWALAGALFWITCSSLAGPIDLSPASPAEAATKNLLHLGTATLLVLPLVFGDQRRGAVRAVLTSAPLQHLGRTSYGLFLLHMPLLLAGTAALSFQPTSVDLWWVALGTWTSAVLLAEVGHRLLEIPAERLRHLVPDRRPREAGTSPATTAATAPSAST